MAHLLVPAATLAVLVLLVPGLVIVTAGVPRAGAGRGLATAVVAVLLLVTVSWVALGSPTDVAALQGAVAVAATAPVAVLVSRSRAATAVWATAAVWAVVVAAPVAYSVFDASTGLLAGLVGTVDFGDASLLGVAVGAAALAWSWRERRAALTGAVELPGGGAGAGVRGGAWVVASAALALLAGWTTLLVGAELVVDSTTASLALNSVLAALAAVVTWTIVQLVCTRRLDARGPACGLVAGLVAVSAGAPWLPAGWAAVVGATAGLVAALVHARSSRRGHGAWAPLIAVSLWPAVIGMLLTGVLSDGPGFINSGQPDLAISQAVGAAIVFVLSLGVTALLALAAFRVRRPAR